MPEIDKKNLESEIRAIVAEITEIEPEKIILEADFVEKLGMDSMMALEVLASIEKKYKIQIPEENLMKIKNLKEILKLVNEFLKK